jgi:hypothetical protein
MQLSFYLVYYHSTCFGRGSRPSSGVIYKTVLAATSVCHTCGWSSSISCGICKCCNDFVKIVCVTGSCAIVKSLGTPWVGCPCGLCCVVVLLLYTVSVTPEMDANVV